MTRSVRLLAVAVLAIVLALSSAQNAFSSQWIIYDNNTESDTWAYTFVGVRFSLPTGVSSAHLLAVSFYWAHEALSVQGSGMVMAIRPLQDPAPATVHITPAPPTSGPELTTPIAVPTPIYDQWNTVDLSDRNIIVSGDFYAVIEQLLEATATHDSSSSNSGGRSVYGDSLDTMTILCCGTGHPRNFMIRAEIDPIVSPGVPVGGFVEPVNKLAVFAPYLALFGLVATVAVVVVKPWKRTRN